jgi:hypothetical protein
MTLTFLIVDDFFQTEKKIMTFLIVDDFFQTEKKIKISFLE